MSLQVRRIVSMVGTFSVLCAAATPAWAGRVTRGSDPGFELTRIVSQFRGRTSEVIAPGETEPSQPIAGETLLIGTSNVFPEGVKLETFRQGEGWRTLTPADYSFTATLVTPDGASGLVAAVVVRVPAAKVARIQNAFVRITIQPFPGPGLQGDVLEGVFLRGAVN
jgi:hypothetical protein